MINFYFQIFHWIGNLLEAGGSEAESRLVFMHFSKLLRALEPQSSLSKEAWNRINLAFECESGLEYRHFLFCYILASGEVQNPDSKSLRFEGQKDEENVTKMPKLSGFYNEELLLSVVQHSIARGINGNPIKEGSYIFTIEALNHFPTLNVAQCEFL